MSRIEENAPDNQTDGAPRKDDIGTDGSKEEVLRLSKELGISVEEAERSVYGKVYTGQQPELTLVQDIAELREGMKGVILRARVITFHTGQRRSQDGEYHFGMLGDSKGTIGFTAWSDFDISPGMAILIKNAFVRSFKGKLELSMNEQTSISILDDVDGLYPSIKEGMAGTITELHSGSKRVDVECRIIEFSRDEVVVNDDPRMIIRGVAADHSGRIDITCWDELPLELGRCYRIQGGNVKEYRGIMKLNLDAGTMIKGISDDRLPPMDDLLAPRDSRLMDLLEGRFSGQVRIRGTVIDVRSGSGIFRRCEDCGRKLVKSQCVVHGKRKGEEDLAVRAVFDDGSGTCMIKGNRMLVESILDRPMEVISAEVRESLEPDMIHEELRSKLVGRSWTFTGDPILDDYGVTISVSEMTGGMDMDVLKDEVSLLMEVIS